VGVVVISDRISMGVISCRQFLDIPPRAAPAVPDWAFLWIFTVYLIFIIVLLGAYMININVSWINVVSVFTSNIKIERLIFMISIIRRNQFFLEIR
jgi:hypothetical protein